MLCLGAMDDGSAFKGFYLVAMVLTMAKDLGDVGNGSGFGR